MELGTHIDLLSPTSATGGLAVTSPLDEGDEPGHGEPERLSIPLPRDCDEGLPPKALERRFRQAHRAGDMSRRAAAWYAAEIVSRGTHDLLGFSSVRAYARKRLKMAPSTFRRYANVGQKLRELPVIDDFFAKDRLDWSVVRLLVTVATPKTERAWAEWAEGLTVREVRPVTERRELGQLPTDSDKRTIHTTKTPFKARLNPVQQRLLEDVRGEAEAEVGATMGQLELLIWLAHKARQGREPRPDRPDPALDPLNHGPAVPFELRDEPTSKKLRKEIRERDGNRCVACSGTKRLTVHHLRWRRYGGRTAPDNLVTLCEGCHSLVHDRFLILRGTATDLELLDRDGEALGERQPLGKQFVVPSYGRSPEVSSGSASVDGAEADELHLDRATPAEPEPEPLAAPPAEVDAPWWRRHEHLFRWDRQRGGLVFEPGLPRHEESPSTAEGAEGAASDGRPAVSGPGLRDLVGQDRVRRHLEVVVEAARRSGDQLGHTLLSGPPGLGKTSLARALARDLGAGFHQLMAPTIRDPELLVRQLCSLRAGDVVFLDEVHRLPRAAAEVLYDALERGELNLPVAGAGWSQRSLRIELEPFTLIAATTELDLLPSPLVSRFVYREQLSFYRVGELEEVLERAARQQGLELSAEARRTLAEASRDTPRQALSLLRTARDEALVGGVTRIDAELATTALARAGHEATGINEVEREYLDALAASGGCLGAGTLAARLGVSRATLRRVIEPVLLRKGLVAITPRGRRLVGTATGGGGAEGPPQSGGGGGPKGAPRGGGVGS